MAGNPEARPRVTIFFSGRTPRMQCYMWRGVAWPGPRGAKSAEAVTALAAAEPFGVQLFLTMCVKHGQDFIGG